MTQKIKKENNPQMKDGFVRNEFLKFLNLIRLEKGFMSFLNRQAHLQWRHLSRKNVRDIQLSKAIRILVNWAYHFETKEEFIASATGFLSRVWDLADQHLDEFNDEYTSDKIIKEVVYQKQRSKFHRESKSTHEDPIDPP